MFNENLEWLALNSVDDGNRALYEGDINKAINKYNRAIKLCPLGAIPYYNKRIAKSMQRDVPSALENEGFTLENRGEGLFLSNPVLTRFVINTIAAVPEHEFSDDSSDEEVDEEFNVLCKDFEFPFTTKSKRNIKRKTEEIISDALPRTYECPKESKVVDEFLLKVLKEGLNCHNYASQDCRKFSTIAVSLALNRMYSLSTRKNKSLTLELESYVKTKEIKYERFGYYWMCQWYGRDGQPVSFEDVRSYYKKLKRVNPDLAKIFIEQEKVCEYNVPYQQIREYAKNHWKTKKLVSEFRDNNSSAIVYLHLVDVDVCSFNYIYDAYFRILNHCHFAPTVMTTGYEYDPEYKDFKFASKLDRMCRIITTLYVPFGTYYPEPNLCVLIPQNCDTVPESFIDIKAGKTLESPILLRAIQAERRNAFAIFSEDSPIITAIPERVKVLKHCKKPINFSIKCYADSSVPSNEDIKKYGQISQSHSNTLVWLSSLFINHAIRYDTGYKSDDENIMDRHNRPLKGVDKQCKSLLTNIHHKKDLENSISKLARRIGDFNTEIVLLAMKARDSYIDNFCKSLEKVEEEDEVIDIMTNHGIDIQTIPLASIIQLANSSFLNLIKYNIVAADVLCELDIEKLIYFTTDTEIVNALYYEEVHIDDLVFFFEDHFEDFVEAKTKYALIDIITKYKENPLHLQFMSDDPVNVVYLNSNDYEVIEFAIENEYIDGEDIYEIKSMIYDGRDFCCALMEFDMHVENAINKKEENLSNFEDRYKQSDDEFYSFYYD